MTTALVSDADRPVDEITLPLLVPRSAVYWPRRDTASLSGSRNLARLLEVAPADRLAAVAAAVACVLFRYTQARAVGVGVCGRGGRLHRLSVPIDGRSSLAQVAGTVAGMMADPRFVVDNPAEPQGVRNPDFAVLVAEPGAPGPDLRQDATIIFDPVRVSLDCEYHSRLFDSGTAQRFLGHVMAFVRAKAEDGDRLVRDVAYLGPDELDAILAVTCPPPSPFPRDETLQSLFRATARAQPEAPAIEFGDTTLRYGELDVLSGRLAAGLAARGAKPGARIGICIRPGIEQIASLLAVLRLGAVPVPLDHAFPRRRLATITASAQLDVLVTEDGLAERVAGLADIVLPGDALRAWPETAAVEGSADDLAYILFTSGSTGTPKGVAMGQRSLVNLLTWQNEISPAAGRRTLNRSSMAFDVGFQEIFSTLCFGGLLVVASETDRADVAALLKLVATRRIARMFVPPVALVQMAELFDEQSTDLSALRHVIVAGEQLKVTPSVVRLFRTCAATVTNQYGPTETHVATSYDLPGSSIRWPLQPPIGRPIANARVHVLDAAGHICPLGVVGEIAIGGVPPARGYVNDPDGTARRFVPDRLPGAGPDATMYLTGDLGRLSTTGQLDFIGRNDDQIKLRGYRIELGDIEAHAMGLPGVKLAAAALKTRGPGSDPFLALYVEPRAGAPLDPALLRSRLAEALPQHMVPALGAIVIMDALPLNSNGKVDRARLPAFETPPDHADAGADQSLAERVAAIWRRHLHLDRVESDDDFASLGGHSLTAIQIVSSVNSAFGINVPVVTLLRGGSLGQFTEAVARFVDAKLEGSKAVGADRAAPSRTTELKPVPLPDRRTIEAPYPAEARHFHTEVFDRQVYLRGGISLAPRATVIDVGANIGVFTLFVLERSKEGRVIAIEPAPVLARALRRNTAALGAAVEVLECGLSNRDGRAQFTFYPLLTGMSSFVPDAAKDRRLLAGLIARARADDLSIDKALADVEDDIVESRIVAHTIEVPIRRLSTVMAELKLGVVDLLKIDVQRGEELVLDGVDAADWPRIRQVVVEHQDGDGSGGAVAARLAAAGFATRTEQDRMHAGTDVVYTYAVRPS